MIVYPKPYSFYLRGTISKPYTLGLMVLQPAKFMQDFWYQGSRSQEGLAKPKRCKTLGFRVYKTKQQIQIIRIPGLGLNPKPRAYLENKSVFVAGLGPRLRLRAKGSNRRLARTLRMQKISMWSPVGKVSCRKFKTQSKSLGPL